MSLNPCGDQRDLFDALFERHRSLIFSWLLGQTGNRETAADLLQETFVKVWRSISQVAAMQPDGQRIWIRAIARNVLLDWRRRSIVRAHLSSPMPAGEVAAPDTSPVIGPEQEALQAAIESLPVAMRTVLVLSVVEGMSSEEIGATLGRPAGTVRSQLFEARRRLARKLGLS